MKTWPATVDVEVLLTVAHKFTFSRALIDEYDKEYKTKPNEQILKICKLL